MIIVAITLAVCAAVAYLWAIDQGFIERPVFLRDKEPTTISTRESINRDYEAEVEETHENGQLVELLFRLDRYAADRIDERELGVFIGRLRGRADAAGLRPLGGGDLKSDPLWWRWTR